MKDNYIQSEAFLVGQKEVRFSERVIRDRYRMQMPADFIEDKNLVSNYTYLFSQDKSPLSIAIKYSPVTATEEMERQIAVYFGKVKDAIVSREENCAVHYRETVTESKFLSVYSLRFAVEVAGGLLFGCFNSSADYKDDWRPVILKMLGNTQPV